VNIYINDGIPFTTKVSNISYENQDTSLASDMDFGTHVRSKGDAIIETITCDLSLTNQEYGDFLEWFTIAKASVFYAKFPDRHYPKIEHDKYYAFSFKEQVIPKSRIGNHSFKLSLVLYWHFRIPPVERIV